jgi:hypothetical protein
VNAFLRLVELSRIPQHDQVPCGMRNGQHVRERQLSGFIHDQHVHTVAELRSRPSPRGSAEQLDLPRLETFTIARVIRVEHELGALQRFGLVAPRVVRGRELHVGGFRRLECALQE